MTDFSSRSFEAEIMDDLDIKGDVVPQTLKELEVIAKLLGGYQVTLSGIKKILRSHDSRIDQIHIADMGCGGGDMLKLIAEWAEKQKINVHLTGIDANQNIINYARENTKEYSNIEFFTGNVLNPENGSENYDIIISTLFLHHFTEDESTFLLSKWFRESRLGLVINDLHRHPLAYHSIKILTQLFSKSDMVKNDGPLSVLRAFSKNDLKKILESAGIDSYLISWAWAFRWKIIIIKDLM